MKCILHIGFHKTGSSSIQKSFAGYDDDHTFYARLGGPNHSVAVRTAFGKGLDHYHVWRKRGLTSQQKQQKRNEFLEVLRHELTRTDRERIIISAEGASNMKADDVLRFTSFLKEYCDEIKVVAYLRDPVSFAMSALQQQLQGGLTDVPDVVNPGYKPGLTRYSKAVGKENLILRKFDRGCLLNGDVVDDFGSLFDLDLSKVKRQRVNDSISVNAMKILYRFNREMPLFNGDPELAASRNSFIAALKYATAGSGKPEPQAFTLVANVKSVNWLRNNFEIEFEQPGENSNGGDVEDWLQSLDGAASDQLIAFLQEQGISQEFDRDPLKLACRTFFLAIERGPFNPETGKFEVLAQTASTESEEQAAESEPADLIPQGA